MPRKFKSERDRQLQKKYGITQDEYDTMIESQENVCAICEKPPTNRSLHTDHWHALAYWKLKTFRTDDGWCSQTDDDRNPISLSIQVIRKMKSEAIKEVRRQLLRLSVRGGLCFGCNSLLRWGRDNPTILRKAAQYLEEYNHKLKETGQENARKA